MFFVIDQHDYADRSSNDMLGASWCETHKRTLQAFDTTVSVLANLDSMAHAISAATGRAMSVTMNGWFQGFDALRTGSMGRNDNRHADGR